MMQNLVLILLYNLPISTKKSHGSGPSQVIKQFFFYLFIYYFNSTELDIVTVNFLFK